LTSSGDEYNFKRAKELGTQRYILKKALPDELIYVIQFVGNWEKGCTIKKYLINYLLV